MIINKSRLLFSAICLAVLLNNLSQLPFFVEMKITSPIAMIGWALAFVFVLGDFKIRIQSTIIPLLTVILCAIFWMFTNNNYISDLNRSYFLSLAVYFIGYNYSKYLNKESFRIVELLYILSAVLVSISVWYSFLLGTNSLNLAEYIYTPKNSLSLILLTAIVLLFVSFIIYRRVDDKRYLRLALLIALIFELYVLFSLRSRATIVGLMLSIIIFLIIKGGSKKTNKYRLLVIVILLIMTIALLLSENFYSLVFNNILFAGRNQSDLDSLSSGRLTIISHFPELIKGHWLTGIGEYYLESFPLAELLNNGIIVGIAQIVFAISPLIWWIMIGRKTLCKEYNLLFACITFAYVANGLFECLAPFGPGAKCSFLWLLFGIMTYDSEWKLDDNVVHSNTL